MQNLVDMISKEDMGIIFKNIHALLALVDSGGRFLSWNSAFETCKSAFPSAEKLEDLFLQKDKQEIQSKLQGKIAEHIIMEFPLGGQGSATLCECHFIPLSKGRMLFVVEGIESDEALKQTVEMLNRRVKMFQNESVYTKKIARNKQIEMESIIIQAQEVAQIDPLTFLHNRRMILKGLQDEVIRAQRYKTELTISVVDVDKFKSVNDTFGHIVGDEVLRQIAHQLRDGIRHPDVAGRYGGEEFLILLPNANQKAASEQAERLCKRIRETVVTVDNHDIKISVSIGIAQYRADESWDSLLNRADNAMYKAKDKGRDRWELAD